MKKIILGLIATLMFSSVVSANELNANSISNNFEYEQFNYDLPVNPFENTINLDKRYAVKLLVHLGVLGAYGLEFEFEWPIAPPSNNPFESENVSFNKDGSLTISFNQKFPVDVLVIEEATIAKQILKESSDTSFTILPGKYEVSNGNTVTFNLK